MSLKWHFQSVGYKMTTPACRVGIRLCPAFFFRYPCVKLRPVWSVSGHVPACSAFNDHCHTSQTCSNVAPSTASSRLSTKFRMCFVTAGSSQTRLLISPMTMFLFRSLFTATSSPKTLTGKYKWGSAMTLGRNGCKSHRATINVYQNWYCLLGITSMSNLSFL